jgi:nicotinate-nucleotide pyrophosphorylase (carboxylating)
MDASKELNMENPAYEQAVRHYVMDAYMHDIGGGDVTTEYFVPDTEKERKVIAEIVAQEAGILAGIQEAEWFLNQLRINVTEQLEDGAHIKAGQIIMKLQGPTGIILSGERTLLNLLQRMSGVATATDKLVSQLPKTIILLATRKTLWGLLDKRAVAVGGGGTHRLSLSDAVLLKDNHLPFVKNLKQSLETLLAQKRNARFIEIECETEEEVDNFLRVYSQLKPKLSEHKIIVMLDNFTSADVRKVIPKLKSAGLYVELSGGIDEKNIRDYMIDGVNAISSGAITGKAGNLDISLVMKKRLQPSVSSHKSSDEPSAYEV